MKPLKNFFLTLFVSFFFFNLTIEAQRIQVITPSNINAAAREVSDIFGNRINVSTEDIRDFYLQQWNGEKNNYSPFCKRPEVFLENTENGYARFKWQSPYLASDIFGDDSVYNISYLRLSDGISYTETTTENNIDLFIPNDLYIVVFQTKCGDLTSALDIIIIEKPILFIPKGGGGCNCLGSNLIWESEASLTDPLFVSRNWDQTNYTQKYYGLVELSDGLSASFIATVQFGAEGPEKISINPDCMTNVKLNPDNTYIFIHEPNHLQDHLGIFGFFSNNTGVSNAPQFSFNLAPNTSYSINKVYLYTCTNIQNNDGIENRQILDVPKNISFKSLSNPFKTNLQVVYDLPKQENVSIVLYNILGEQVKVLKKQNMTEAGSHQLDIDLSNLVDGVYICVLKTKDTSIPLKLLKKT